MVRIVKLDPLEYSEAILDGPEFRNKLHQHEKHIVDLNKNLKVLLKKIKDVIAASEALRNAQDSFSVCLRDFQIGFTGPADDQESDVVDSLDFVFFLFQDIKEFSNSMINAGHNVIKVLDSFRKNKLDTFNEKKKDYERQTTRYCSNLEKNLQAVLVQSKKEKLNYDDVRETEKSIKEENQLFYVKCLEYVYSIQEFEYDWFSFFSGNVLQYVQSWMNFYHESYEKHMECESRVAKSKEGLGKLTQKIEEIKQGSSQLIQRTLKNPEYSLNSYQVYSSELHASTSKQGYLYLLEKKTLGSSGRVKMFCKYYKELRRFECVPYSQTVNKQHQPEVYYVNSCVRSSSDKKLAFELSLSNDKGYSNVHTYQATHNDDYKTWFVAMEGKELTPVLSSYANRIEPVYILDRNGINFVKRCIQLLENDKLSEEGIYRKNGVSHKILAFIERNYHNLAGSTISGSNNTNTLASSNHSNSSSSSNMDSLSNGSVSQHDHSTRSNQSAYVRQSNSFYTLNGVVNSSSVNNIEQAASPTSAALPTQSSSTSSSGFAVVRNATESSKSSSTTPPNSSPLLDTSTEHNSQSDTCTITSALKHYLLHLREPLMTYKYNQQFLDACSLPSMSDKFTEIHKLVHSLPDINYELLDVLVSHLSRVAAQASQNKMTAGNLATCFGPTVFRAELESVTNLYNIKFYSEIVEILIIYHDEMFSKRRPDPLFLSQLTPIRANHSSMMTNLTTINSSSASSNASHNLTASSSLFSTPIYSSSSNTTSASIPFVTTTASSSASPSSSNGKFKNQSSIKRTGGPLNELLSYKNVLMNSSKASVSSSSDSSSEFTLNSTNATPTTTKNSTNNSNNSGKASSKSRSIITTSVISTPISTSSPFNQRVTNNSATTNGPLASTTTSNTSAGSRPLNTTTTSTPNQNKKPNKSMPTSSTSMPLNVSISSVTSTPTTLNSSLALQKSSNSMNSLSSNYNLSSLSPSTSSQDKSPNSNRPRRARTLYQCLADNPSELSFEANVILLNVRKSKESGWLEASYNGKSGLVPGNYVQLLDD